MNKNYKLLALLVIFTFILSSFAIFITPTVSASGESWLNGYICRKSITIAQTANAGTGYAVPITIINGTGTDNATAVYVNSTATAFGDIRFTASDGVTQLSYFMDPNNINQFYVKVTDNLSSAASTIYVYWSNSTSTTASNGYNTFLAFDDFGSTLGNWTSQSGTWSISGGVLTQSASSNSYLTYNNLNAYNVSISYQIKISTTSITTLGGAVACWANSTNFYQTNIYHTYDTPAQGIMTGKKVANTDTNSFTSWTWGANTWYNMTYQVYTGNQKSIATGFASCNRTDTNFVNGTVGLWGISNAGGIEYFDNFIVRPYAGSDPTISSTGSTTYISPQIYVSSAHGTVSPTVGSHSYSYGQNVTFSVSTVDSGYQFNYWKINGLMYTSNSVSVLLYESGNATAYYSAIGAGDWLFGYAYRKELTISASSGTGTNYLVPITITDDPTVADSSSIIYLPSNSSLLDVRFTASDGTTLLNYTTAIQSASYNVIKYAGNPIFGPSEWYDINNTRELTSMYKENGVYYLIYTGSDNTAQPVWRICLANSTDLVTWHKMGPILDISASGWDSGGLDVGILKKVGDTYYLFYQGNTGVWGFGNGDYFFGVATSSSINGPYTKYANNPIISPSAGTWDSHGVAVSCVEQYNSTHYVAFYSGYDGSGSLTAHDIGLAFSTDLFHWTKYAGNPIGLPSLEGAFIFQSGGTWYMAIGTIGVINGIGMNYKESLYRSTSADLTDWEYVQDLIAPDFSGSTWDSWHISNGAVWSENGTITLLYGGNDRPLGQPDSVTYYGYRAGYATFSMTNQQTFLVQIPGNLSVDDQIIYAYCGKTNATSITNTNTLSYYNSLATSSPFTYYPYIVSPNWGTVSGTSAGAWAISNSVLTHTTSVSNSHEFALVAYSGSNYAVGCTLNLATKEESEAAGIVIRYSNSSSGVVSCYLARIEYYTSTKAIELIKINGNTETVLGTYSYNYLTLNRALLELCANGSSIQVKLNGASIINATDSSISSGSYIGVEGEYTSGTVQTFSEIFVRPYVYPESSLILFGDLETNYKTITASATGAIISPSGSINVIYGENQTFTYSSNLGYYINSVVIDGTPVSVATYPSNYTFYNVTTTHTIYIGTSPNTYYLNLSILSPLATQYSTSSLPFNWAYNTNGTFSHAYYTLNGGFQNPLTTNTTISGLTSGSYILFLAVNTTDGTLNTQTVSFLISINSNNSTGYITGANSTTLYFIADSFTYNNLTAYGLTDQNSESAITLATTGTGNVPVEFGFRVWLVHYKGLRESELTTGSPVAVINRTTDGSGYQSAYWTPEQAHIVLGYDTIKITMYSSFDNGTSWTALAVFTTEQLVTDTLLHQSWNFTVWTAKTTDSNTLATLKFGSTNYNSRIENVGLNVPTQSQQGLLDALNGNWLLLILTTYTNVMGPAFYVAILFLFSGVTYLRHRSTVPVLMIFALFGFSGGIIWMFVPPFASVVVDVILAVICAFTLWKLIR